MKKTIIIFYFFTFLIIIPLYSLPSENTQLFSPRYEHQFFVFNNQFYIMGGKHSTGETEYDIDNDLWVSDNLSTWVKKQKNIFPIRRQGYSLAIFKNKIWIYGGYQPVNQKYLNEIWVSEDGSQFKLVTKNAPFPPRIKSSVFEFKDRLWMIGGNRGLDYLYTDIWSSKNGYEWIKSDAGLPFRFYHEPPVIVQQNTVFLFSSENGVYSSEDGETWKKISVPEVLTRRLHFSAVFHDGSFLIIGGEYLSENVIYHEMFNDVWKSENGIDWVQIAPYPVDSLYPNRDYIFKPSRRYQKTISNQERIIVSGGLDFSGKPINDIWSSNNGYLWMRIR